MAGTGLIGLNIPPAATLDDVGLTADLTPLRSGDSRYVTLAEGNRGRSMKLMRRCLDRAAHNAAAGRDGYAKIAFSGHRGCGKTTELLRLEDELKDRWYPLHLTLDENLRDDFDYSLMLLWVCEALVDRFAADGMPIDGRLAEEVARWFASSSRTTYSDEQVNGSITVDAEAKARIGFAGLGLGIFTRIKSEARGNTGRRKEIREELQRYSSDLLNAANRLIDGARAALAKRGGPQRLLIVQDNLDRLGKDTAAKLLFSDGDLLKRIEADCIFTAPVSLTLAPHNLGTVFQDCLTLPMIRVQDREGAANDEGLGALAGLVGKRVELDRLVDGADTLRRLCALSGGSVRDLVRLLGLAADNAAIDDKPCIDGEAVEQAAKSMRIEYERILLPARAYYPRLATIHRRKDDGCTATGEMDGKKAAEEREQFAALLLNGAVLEYNGDRSWYDVHPVVRDIEAFRHALSATAPAAEPAAG